MIREVLTLERLQALSPEEAAARLAARLSDEPDADTEATLAAWLERDPDHLAAWSRAQRALAPFHPLGGDPLLGDLLREARRAEQRAAWPRFTAAAAALALLTFGALWFGQSERIPRLSPPESVPHAQAPVAIPYATPRGLPHKFVLADGSDVVLDTESAIEVSFSRARREVRLIAGRASFDVTHDAARPFVVRAGDREVTAVGTRFDVRVDPREVRVVLIEGRVRVAAAGLPGTELQAGQQLTAARGAPAQVARADLNAELSWRQGLLTFNDEPLARAVAELNRYSRDQMVVASPSVGEFRISGVFKAGDPERFARSLSQVHPLRISRAGPHQLVIEAAN